MSHWTYIYGTIRVSPLGRTQEEKTYILNTVLKHLPVVTGSERDMEVIVNIDNRGCYTSSSCDEFDMRTNNLRDSYGQRSQRGWMECAESYLLTMSCSLRDREFDETVREFEKWLSRLAKRVWVEEILVSVKGGNKSFLFDNSDPYYDMFEDPSWCNSTGEPNWCEYMMWRNWKDTPLPLALVYKYYNDEEADKEFEKWIAIRNK